MVGFPASHVSFLEKTWSGTCQGFCWDLRSNCMIIEVPQTTLLEGDFPPPPRKTLNNNIYTI